MPDARAFHALARAQKLLRAAEAWLREGDTWHAEATINLARDELTRTIRALRKGTSRKERGR